MNGQHSGFCIVKNISPYYLLDFRYMPAPVRACRGCRYNPGTTRASSCSGNPGRHWYRVVLPPACIGTIFTLTAPARSNSLFPLPVNDPMELVMLNQDLCTVNGTGIHLHPVRSVIFMTDDGIYRVFDNGDMKILAVYDTSTHHTHTVPGRPQRFSQMPSPFQPPKGCKASARASVMPFLQNRVMWIVELHTVLPDDPPGQCCAKVYIDANTGDMATYNPCLKRFFRGCDNKKEDTLFPDAVPGNGTALSDSCQGALHGYGTCGTTTEHMSHRSGNTTKS